MDVEFETLEVGAVTTFGIKANPPSDSEVNAVSIRLQVKGMEITNYFSPGEDGWIVLPECDGGEFFTSSDLCVGLAKAENMKTGESLGTVEVKITSVEDVSLEKISGTKYSDGTNEYEDIEEVTINEQDTQTSDTELESAESSSTNEDSSSGIEPLEDESGGTETTVYVLLGLLVVLMPLSIFVSIKAFFPKKKTPEKAQKQIPVSSSPISKN